MYYLKELLKFFKQNLFQIIGGTFIVATIYLLLANNLFNVKNETQEIKVADTEIIQNQKNEISEARPASFYFYLEDEEGDAFSNSLIIEQYILSTDTLKNISKELNNDLVKLIDYNSNTIKVYYNESGESKIIGVTRNESTNLLELSVNVGNDRENMVISRYFYDFINSERIPFLVDKNVYFFNKPSFKKIDRQYDVLAEDALIVPKNNLLKDIVKSVLLGIFVTVVGLLLFTLFTKKLKYIFSYYIKDSDRILLIDHNYYTVDDLVHFIKSSKSDKRVIVFENESPILINLFKKIQFDTNLYQVSDIDEVLQISYVNEIIYIIEENNTSRTWYRRQRKLDKFHELPISLVQINNPK